MRSTGMIFYDNITEGNQEDNMYLYATRSYIVECNTMEKVSSPPTIKDALNPLPKQSMIIESPLLCGYVFLPIERSHMFFPST